jgi:hypothetical protein
MRNWVGAQATRQLADAVGDALARRSITPKNTPTKSGKIKAIEWEGRALLVDRKAKLKGLGNNIDVHLLRTDGKTQGQRVSEVIG